MALRMGTNERRIEELKQLRQVYANAAAVPYRHEVDRADAAAKLREVLEELASLGVEDGRGE